MSSTSDTAEVISPSYTDAENCNPGGNVEILKKNYASVTVNNNNII